MSYRIRLPAASGSVRLNIVEPNSTSVQRALRRGGLAAYEPPTVATLLTLFEAQRPGFGFFDVGANMGLYALLCAKLFEPGVVTGFEPTPSTASVARKIVKANRLDIDVVAAALSDENGQATLHLSPVSDSSNSLVEGFRDTTESVVVPTMRLDDHVRRTGQHPDVMKIDVETHEPAVLAGAAETIRAHRPYIVIEVLRRRGRDHGVEITEAMEGYGYAYYQLADEPTWARQDEVRGAGTLDRDWLLAPTPLDDDFPARCQEWRRRLAECGPETNSRVPIHRSVLAAYRRGGPGEVWAAARRYADSIRRDRAAGS